ncbi:hypothetical protein BDD12DRAFT_898092 [Trichophaea hybrida]|nr:hypothetical protein BDD12DRAFT_898092 [Trichophaea hybrida]
MSSSGQRGKKHNQQNWPQNEQGNEQGNLQGGGGSRVKPALERNGLFCHVPTRSTEEYFDLGAPQNISSGGKVGHTATTHNSGNRTMSYSNNTVDNTRTYKHSKHNEFISSAFNGPVNYGDNVYHFPQPGPPMDARMHAVLQNLVQTIGWDSLSSQLSIVNQDKHRSTISPFDPDEPENFWIFRNIDFMQWESANHSRTLLLSAPPGHRTTEACSHFIDFTKKKASQTNTSVLYFFCSSAPKARRSTCLIHTLLHQVVRCSKARKANSIAAAFLSTLVDGHFRRHSSDFGEDDQLDTTVNKVLDAPDIDLIEALAEAIKKAEIRKLSIIVDDLWEDVADWFVQIIMEAAPELKALLTSRYNSFRNIPDGILFIEYDKERQECLGSLQYDDTRYDKISEEHHDTLQWFWEHPQYLKWSVSTTSSLLYIEGKPGSGKSTLAKYFEKNLVKREPKASSSTVARYFYTFRGTILERTHENMMRSILCDILQQDESAFFIFNRNSGTFNVAIVQNGLTNL